MFSALRLFFFVLFFVIAALCLAPLLTLAEKLIANPSILSHLLEPDILSSLRETLFICLSSSLVSLAFALPLSWWLVRTNVPARSIFRRVLLFAYIVPPYLFAVAWVALAVPGVGLLNKWVGTSWINIYSRAGLIWVFSTAYLPVFLAPLWNAMESMDPSLEEAARICGASPLRVFAKITLPCLLPTIVSAFLLYMLAVTSAFGLPAIVGNPARIYLLTTKIFTATRLGGLTGLEQAFCISLWLVLSTAIILLANSWVRKKFQYRLIGGKTSRSSSVDLGVWRYPVFGVITAFVVISLLFPLASVVLSSFLEVAGEVRWDRLTFANYEYLFSMSETVRALLNSTLLALGAGVICVALGFFVAYFRDRTFISGRSALAHIATLPFAIPGTLMALGFIVSYGTGWGLGEISLLGSPILLLLAYCSKDLAVAVQSLTPALSRIDLTLDEAARVCGANRWKVIRHILIPILMPAMGSIFILTALPALSELTMSVLLSGPGTETIGTVLFQLQDYANPLAACSMATVLIVILAAVMLVSRVASKQLGKLRWVG